ncbi:MAG: multiheme c-type cytochrome, partial [Planctomycetota bacterium]
MNLRLLFGLALTPLAGWALFAVFVGPAPEEDAHGAAVGSVSFETSRNCAECHTEVWDEWSVSQHAQAWVNPDVRALSNEFSNKDCIDCHAPRPIFETGVGNRVLPRSVRRAEGIDCIACHLLPATEDAPAAVAGTFDRDAPCNPRIERKLG